MMWSPLHYDWTSATSLQVLMQCNTSETHSGETKFALKLKTSPRLIILAPLTLIHKPILRGSYLTNGWRSPTERGGSTGVRLCHYNHLVKNSERSWWCLNEKQMLTSCVVTTVGCKHGYWTLVPWQPIHPPYEFFSVVWTLLLPALLKRRRKKKQSASVKWVWIREPLGFMVLYQI